MRHWKVTWCVSLNISISMCGCGVIVPVRIGTWHLQSSRVSIITIHYPFGDQAHTSGDTSIHHQAKVVDIDYKCFYLHSWLGCIELHNNLCGLTFPCVRMDAWCWEIFAHLANASPQSPVPGSLGREQSKHLLANIELGWAPLGVVIYIITRADSFIGASVYPAQVTTPIVLTPPRSKLELETKVK